MLIDFYKETYPGAITSAVKGDTLQDILDELNLNLENNGFKTYPELSVYVRNVADYSVDVVPTRIRFLGINWNNITSYKTIEELYQIIDKLMVKNACNKIIIKTESGMSLYKNTLKDLLLKQAIKNNFTFRSIHEEDYILMAVEKENNLQTRTLCL